METDQNKTKKMMEDLSSPQVSSDATKKILKITLLNSKKTAWIGLLFFLLPFLFILANVTEYGFGHRLGFISQFIDWIVSFDDTPVVNWLIRFLLLGAPAVVALANFLAITHFYVDKELREFNMTVRLRWINILVLLLCLGVFSILFGYLIVENINHP